MWDISDILTLTPCRWWARFQIMIRWWVTQTRRSWTSVALTLGFQCLHTFHVRNALVMTTTRRPEPWMPLLELQRYSLMAHLYSTWIVIIMYTTAWRSEKECASWWTVVVTGFATYSFPRDLKGLIPLTDMPTITLSSLMVRSSVHHFGASSQCSLILQINSDALPE